MWGFLQFSGLFLSSLRGFGGLEFSWVSEEFEGFLGFRVHGF